MQEKTDQFASAQELIKELSQQLEGTRQEVSELSETVKKYECESREYRNDRNKVTDERDSLQNMLELKNTKIQHLELDVNTLKDQLQKAITAKCNAIAKYDEIQHKESSIESREKHLENEKSLLQNQIVSLTEDLDRNMNELSNIRREAHLKSVTIETKLFEKSEELKIANSNSTDLAKLNAELTAKVEDLTAKLLSQSEEVAKMMEHFKKELSSQTRLADLYKESCDESNNQQQELNNVISELRRMLNDSTGNYSKLNTDYNSHKIQMEQDLEARDQNIIDLKEELKNIKQLLAETEKQSAEEALSKMFPTAAATCKIVKSEKSLTEMFTLYVNVQDQLQAVTKENAHLKLRMEESQKNATIVSKQESDSQTNSKLKLQINTLQKELNDEKEKQKRILAKVEYFEKDNKLLKSEKQDLSRQVCVLLKRIQDGSVAGQQNITDMTSNEVIFSIISQLFNFSHNYPDSISQMAPKQLFSFSDIQSMQENNIKLLNSVRELSAQVEELEGNNSRIDQAKIESQSKHLVELQETIEKQTKMMDLCMQQRDRYKKMYLLTTQGNGSGYLRSQSLNSSFVIGDQSIDIGEALTSASTVSSEQIQSLIAEKEKKIDEMSDKIKEMENQLNSVKEEYDEYRKEKLSNDKIVNEQFDSMRTELSELSTSNCRLLAQVRHSESQSQLQQQNIATFKQQIQTLEDRTRLYETTIAKQETTIQFFQTEIMNNQQKLTTAEIKNEKLKNENRSLKESVNRLKAEREVSFSILIELELAT
jgi:nucleoprotein TPR